MQKIDNIEIKNFKSIRHQKIEGCKRINVFIGEPNVGKSNILEAISLLSYLTNNYHVGINELIRLENFTELFNYGNVAEHIEIDFNAVNPLFVRYNQNGGLDFSFIGLFNDTTENGLQIGNKGVDFSIPDPQSVPEFKNPAGFKDFKTDIVKVRPYRFLKNKFDRRNSAITLNTPFGDNLFEVIQNNSAIRSEFGNLLRKFSLKQVYDPAINNLRIGKDLDNDVFFTLPFNSIADTLQRLIFNLTAIKINKEAVLLFEEPEAHMYPPYISKFTSEVMYDENKNQFFITTHSPFLINDFMENLKKEDYSIYTAGYDKETGETLIRKMTDEELHEIYQYGIDLFLNLENYLPHA